MDPRMKDIQINCMYDGWEIYVDDKCFAWNISDDDLGTKSIKELLEHLGYNVTVKVSAPAEVVKRLLKRFAEDCIEQVGHKDAIQFVAMEYNINLGE